MSSVIAFDGFRRISGKKLKKNSLNEEIWFKWANGPEFINDNSQIFKDLPICFKLFMQLSFTEGLVFPLLHIKWRLWSLLQRCNRPCSKDFHKLITPRTCADKLGPCLLLKILSLWWRQVYAVWGYMCKYRTRFHSLTRFLDSYFLIDLSFFHEKIYEYELFIC